MRSDPDYPRIRRSTGARRPLCAAARAAAEIRPDAMNPGDSSGEATPVPIPNTEVKLSSAEDTERAAFRENRSSPGFLRFSGPGHGGPRRPPSADRYPSAMSAVEGLPVPTASTDREDRPQETKVTSRNKHGRGYSKKQSQRHDTGLREDRRVTRIICRDHY